MENNQQNGTSFEQIIENWFAQGEPKKTEKKFDENVWFAQGDRMQ